MSSGTLTLWIAPLIFRFFMMCSGLHRQDLPSLRDLLQGTDPVFYVKGGAQLSVPYGEDVDRHRAKALAGRLCPPELSGRRPGGLSPYDDLIPIRLNVLDSPAQVWDRVA